MSIPIQPTKWLDALVAPPDQRTIYDLLAAAGAWLTLTSCLLQGRGSLEEMAHTSLESIQLHALQGGAADPLYRGLSALGIHADIILRSGAYLGSGHHSEILLAICAFLGIGSMSNIIPDIPKLRTGDLGLPSLQASTAWLTITVAIQVLAYNHWSRSWVLLAILMCLIGREAYGRHVFREHWLMAADFIHLVLAPIAPPVKILARLFGHGRPQPPQGSGQG